MEKRFNNGYYNKYQYIIDKDDLLNAYTQHTKEHIETALKRQIDKDRYILNKAALEKAFEKAIDGALKQIEDGAYEVTSAAVNEVIAAISSVGSPTLKQNGSSFAKRLGKEVAKSFGKLLDDYIERYN